MQWLKSPLPPSDSDMSKTPESARDVPTRVRHGDTLLNQHQLFLWWCIAHVSFVVIRLTQSKAGMTRALPRTESGSVRTVACPRCTGLCRSSLRSLAVVEGGARVLSGHLLFSGQVFLVKHESVARATKHGAKEADGKVVLLNDSNKRKVETQAGDGLRNIGLRKKVVRASERVDKLLSIAVDGHADLATSIELCEFELTAGWVC